MPENKETGHLVNTSNMIAKIGVAERHSTEYKPTNPAIALTVLTPLKETLNGVIESLTASERAYTTAVAERQTAYDEMNDKANRSIALLKSSETPADKIDLGISLLKKYKSVRISKRDDGTTTNPANAAAGNEQPRTISTSQQGFINKLGHFKEIAQFLGTVTTYKPNETDLTAEALTTYGKAVDVKNDARNKAADDLSKARAARNKAMYDEPDGAYYLAKKMMDYVAGSLSKDSVFYKELLKYPVRKNK